MERRSSPNLHPTPHPNRNPHPSPNLFVIEETRWNDEVVMNVSVSGLSVCFVEDRKTVAPNYTLTVSVDGFQLDNMDAEAQFPVVISHFHRDNMKIRDHRDCPIDVGPIFELLIEFHGPHGVWEVDQEVQITQFRIALAKFQANVEANFIGDAIDIPFVAQITDALLHSTPREQDRDPSIEKGVQQEKH